MFRKTFFSCIRLMGKRTITTRPHVIYDDQTKYFLSIYPEIVETIMTSELLPKVPQCKKHLEDVIDYNIIKEKRFRPPLSIETFKILEKPENLTEQNLHLSNIIAWCLELIHTYMNVGDDTADQSNIRCDNICWHKQENIGLRSLQDSIFMYEAAFLILKKYFSDKSTYAPFINLFREMNQRYILGQSLDWHFKSNHDFSNFTTDLFNIMARNKGCFSIVEATFQAGCILSNNYQKYLSVKDLIQEMAYAFQIDNDVLDVFEHGKVQVDVTENIRQGQCTWLAVEVLENGNNHLKRIFKENYGRPGEEYENKIIEVYEEMDLFKKYKTYRYQTLKCVKERINKINDFSLRKAILNSYNKIFL